MKQSGSISRWGSGMAMALKDSFENMKCAVLWVYAYVGKI